MSIRISSISLIKLLAIILIIISHITPDFGSSDLHSYISSISATNSLNVFYVVFSKYLGQLGVCVFVVCSAYFLVDRDCTSKRKAIQLEIDAIFVGLISAFICFNISPHLFDLKYIPALIFPMSIGSNWFVTCYILYYLIVPILNKGIRNLEKTQLIKLCLSLFFLYSVAQMVFKDRYYSTHLVGFVCIHCFAALYKSYNWRFKENIRLSKIVFTFSFVFLFLMVFILDIIGLHIDYLSSKMQHFRMFMNPFIVICSFSLLNWSLHSDIKSEIIDKLSTTTFIVYMFHENDIIKNTIRPEFFAMLYSNGFYSHLAFVCLISSFAVFLISIVFSIIYFKTIGIISKKMSVFFERIIFSIMNKLVIIIEKM